MADQSIILKIESEALEIATQRFKEYSSATEKAGKSTDTATKGATELNNVYKTMATINVADKIAQIGKATEKAAQDVELLSKAYTIAVASTDGLTKKQLELRDAISSAGGIAKKLADTNREQTPLYNQSISRLQKLIAEYQTLGKEAPKAEQSIRSEIRQTTQELARKLAHGELNISQIYEMAKASAELKDAMGDANKILSALGSDTFALDATISTLQGVTAGFQVAQGATALFGDENEDLQKALVKLNAVMAISQGLQQIQNTLQKENAGRLGITIAFQKLYTTAVGESTGAMLIFRQALFGLGIGAVIAGIVLLISNWEKIKDAISGATDAMREQQRISKLNSEVHKEATEGIKSEVASLYELLAVAKNENLSKKERQDAIRQINQNYPEYLKNISLENINTEKTNDLIKSQIKLMSLREEVKKLVDKRAGLNLAKENEDELKKQLGFFEKIDLYLYGDLGKTKDEYYNKAKKRIDAQITDIDILVNQKINEIGSSGATTGLVETTKDKVTKSVSESITYLMDEWKKKLSEIEKQIQEMIAKSVLTGKDVDNNIFKKLTADAERLKNMIAEVEKQIEFSKLKIELPNPEKISEDLNNSIPKPKLPFEAVIDNVTIPEDVGEGDLIPPTTQQKFQYEMSKLFNIDLSDPQFKLKLSENLISTAQEISSGIFKLSKDASDARLAILEDEKNRGIITEKQYQEEVRKEKIKQAKQAKAEAIFNIGINIAQAIVKALAQGGIAGAVMGAIVSALGFAQLAIVASKPIPQFRKGIIDLPLGNNRKGIDTIPAMLNEGESIMTTEETVKYRTALKAMRADNFNDLFIRKDLFYPKHVMPTINLSKEYEANFSKVIAGGYDSLKSEFIGLKTEIDFLRKEVAIGNSDRRKGTKEIIKSNKVSNGNV